MSIPKEADLNGEKTCRSYGDRLVVAVLAMAGFRVDKVPSIPTLPILSLQIHGRDNIDYD